MVAMRGLAAFVPFTPALPVGLPAHLTNHPAFLDAHRHSRRVRFLRRAIPLACLGALVFLVGQVFVGLLKSPIQGVSVGKFGIEGRKIVMEKPKLSGFKRDGRSYELTAATATQDLKTPHLMDLKTLSARMQTGNDGWANFTGATGLYDSKSERLDVAGGLKVKTESGIDATLEDARIEFKGGTLETTKPVEVLMTQGHVFSDQMQILDNGRKIVFEGNVRSTYVNKITTPEAAAGAQPPKQETE